MASQWVACTTLLNGSVSPDAQASIVTIGSLKGAEAPAVTVAVCVARPTKLSILGETKCIASRLTEISEAVVGDRCKVTGFIRKATFVEEAVFV